MEGILNTVLKIKPIAIIKEKAVPQRPIDNTTIQEMNAVKAQLKNVQNRFDLYTDFDMAESCIYEMQALEARYRYLIKKAKAEKISRAPLFTTKKAD